MRLVSFAKRRLGNRSASLLPALAPLALLGLDGRAVPSVRALDGPKPGPGPGPGPTPFEGPAPAAFAEAGSEAQALEAHVFAPLMRSAATAPIQASIETAASVEGPQSSLVPTAFLQPLAGGTTDATVSATSLSSEPPASSYPDGPWTTALDIILPAATPGTGTGGVSSAAAIVENPIVVENRRPGNPRSEWDLRNGVGSTNIEGFATAISVNRGGRVDFKVNTNAGDYRIDVYRLGWYGGMGARRVATIDRNAAGTVQPAPLFDPATRLIDCGNWSVTDSWAVPADACSGIYIAKLVREDGTFGENHMAFVVRSDGTPSDVLFQTADTTWVAYNPWGGTNLYAGTNGKAVAVSYNRPFTSRLRELASGPQDWIFGAEYPALLWLERNGYDVSYVTGVDVARDGAGLLDHKVFLSVGHDEYWSGEQRAHVEAARDAGVNLQFWSGNEVYWKIRWETSIDASGTAYRTMVCYKETRDNFGSDPSEIWTGTWRDPRFGGTGLPENALTGTIFQVDSYRLDTVTVPYDMSRLRFWRDTRVAQTPVGGSTTLNGTYLGYEWNVAPDNGFSPDGLIRLSSSTVDVDRMLLDYGFTVGPGRATHNLTLYRDPESRALVFGAGMVYWSWALDANHDNEATPTDPAVQQAMVNLFAEMGVRPQTLEASLVFAVASTDTTAPSATISASGLASGTFVSGQRVTITGSAVDIGGLVAGVEVSTNGGLTWHPAQGTSNWSYRWTVNGPAGERTILARATDDSVNTGLPSAGVKVNVVVPDATSLWDLAAPVDAVTISDRTPVELGMKFKTAESPLLTGFRFYKGATNSGTHSARIWTTGGVMLAQATFTNETASGWQTALLAAPIRLAAETNYIVSYHTTGGYLQSTGYFMSPRENGDLLAPAGENGLYAYGGPGSFPDRTFNAANYWVDVVLDRTPAANVALSLFPDTVVPAVVTVNDAAQVELGTRFRSSADGVVTGIRFYKGPQNTGAHTGSLWTTAGQRLATVSFTGETASGWQTALFSQPVPIAAGVTYIASYHTQGFYSVTVEGFRNGYANGPLSVGSETSGLGNGVYAYGPSAFPTATYRNSNYFVDVVFVQGATAPDKPPVPLDDNGFTVAAGTTLVIAASTLLANDIDPEGRPLTIASVGGATNGTVALSSDRTTVTFTPAAGYTGPASFTYAASDGRSSANATVAVLVGESATAWSLFSGLTPASFVNDGTPLNLGTRFTVSADGSIAALKFYKSPQETGAHLGRLWTASGTLLASVSFTNETASGWQTAELATPVAVVAGQSYIVSHSSNGAYAVTSRGLATTITSGPLSAPASGPAGGNGVYAYGAAGLFPTGTFNATNYFADVVYFRSTAGVNRAPVAVNDTGFTTVRDTPIVIDVGAILANDTDADGDRLTVTSVSAPVNGLAAIDVQTGRITFAPTSGFTGNAGFTYTISDGAGNAASAQVSLTVTAPAAGTGLFAATAAPSILTVNDPNPVELGVKFTTATAGEVTGIRFYKGPNNLGTHQAHLWTSTGTLLASATFANEAASGWQTVSLARPVSLTAGQTYVASYHTAGFYSITPDYFATARTSGPLTAPASDASGGNGVYAYGASGSFPTSTFNRSNYWVDVVFSGQLAA